MPTDPRTLKSVRRSDRYRVVLDVPARVGSRSGTLVDISETGVLATHKGILKTGSIVDIAFSVEDEKFLATGRVETCTVVALNPEDTGGTIYASRIFFVSFGEHSRDLLKAIMAH